MLTHVHCKNCKTALEEKFPLFQGKIAIVFHKYFLKAQGLLKSKRPNLQEWSVKQRILTLGEVKNHLFWGGGVVVYNKVFHDVYSAQTSLKAHALRKVGL
jgi:hypothetical protein